MIPALVLALTLVANPHGTPDAAPLSDEAACRLAHQDGADTGTTYTIKGEYLANFEHTPLLDLQGCNTGLFAGMEGAAAERVERYFQAFRHTCGATLGDTFIRGVFTGHLIAAETEFQGKPLKINRFVVTRFESSDFDPAAVACGALHGA